MADQETHSSRAEQRMLAVAKLKRAASLPRMKDGRRPPMHVEAVSEGEKAQSEEEMVASEEEKQKNGAEQTVGLDEEEQMQAEEEKDKTPEPDSDTPLPPTEKTTDAELEADTELEERPLSPTAVFKKRRSRSRSRSRGSKDYKGKFKAPQSPVPQLGGDSSQDENPLIPSPVMLPMVPPLLSPIPHFPFLQQSRFIRSPTPASPEMSLFYPGTSPPTPLPTLEDIQKGLMRSNSAGSSAAGRRLAMHKLTGGTETYEPSPSPTPPPYLSKLSRNNTVAGGERIAARQNMLSRLGTRITKETDAETASGGEDRGAPSPTPAKRRRRRSRRTSGTANPNPAISDSDFNSNPNTPAIPSTPLPALLNHLAELRAQSTTPNQLSGSRTQSSERVSNATPPPLPVPPINPVEEEPERPEQMRRRSVLIEDPDEEERDLPEQRYVGGRGTPQRSFPNMDGQRVQPSPSNNSSDSGPASGIAVPIFLNQRAASRNEMFPSSPFTTPLKEKTLSDEDEEQVIYPATTARPRTPYANMIESYDREISWVASPVPEIRMPIDDDEDEDDEDLDQEVDVQVEPEEDETPLSGASSNGFSPEAYDDTSPRASSSSKSVLVESEMSPEPNYVPASPSSMALASQPASVDESASPRIFPTRLSVASPIQSVGDRSPLATDFSEWEGYLGNDSPKRAEPVSATTWEKVKSTFSRAGSSTGRRSRTNSIVTRERRDHTDSSVSRESGASLMSAKTDKGESIGTPGQPQAPPLMQSPSASASILSLAPHAPPRGSVSPIPPPSSADMSKYQNAKLFPFPGMLRLEEERRMKGQPSATASSPDVSMQSNGHDDIQAPAMAYSFSNTPTQTPDMNRERILSHQNSDTQLSTKYRADTPLGQSSSPYYPVDVSPSTPQNGSSYNLKLPTTLPGVKQWLSKNSKKKAATPPGTAPGTVSFSPLPVMDFQTSPITNKKPSISDIFGKKANEMGDWEDIGTTHPSTNGDSVMSQNSTKSTANGLPLNGSNATESNTPENGQTSKAHNLVPLDLAAGRGSPYKFPNGPSSLTRLATATPDPSSVSDYPAPTASESSSTTSSQYSLGIHQGPVVLERLEENLSRGSRSPMWSPAIEDPPRKLILSSPVLQVVNPNTVKDRFLFLFNDILVIAKPVTYDQDNLMDTYKMSLPDRKFTVKGVVQLRNLRFCADRSEAQGKATSPGPRPPLIRSFISQFLKDPDHAIATLFTKSNVQDDAVLLGQLLSRTLELDRSRLGEYLSRKTSKTVLKSYLDCFGFAGLRVDVALRVFLHSVNVPRHSHSYGALEHLLDSFTSRWYEANAKFVAYDKDMAVRLVWALAQLNDRLHGGIAEEPGPTDHVRRNVTSKEFLDAFRRYDARYLVSDEFLQELYRSIFHERLCQACPRTYSGSQDKPITIKRALPTRLTYKTQSEPIVFRLPQADPLLTIELYGQDMDFDPPVLQFSKSSEASFRIMGKSLGSKTITMCRSGPNAVKYSGLPLSHTIVVERAFMRNTFQLAFLQSGVKRRYMFSVDDPIIRNEWATCLRRHIDSPIPSTLAGTASPVALKFHKAADAIAFKVLQETLMGPGCSPAHRTNGSASTQNSSISGPHLTGSSVPFTSPMHTRSKSRSRVYHRHGAGKNELDLQRSANSSHDSNDYSPDSSDKANTPEQRSDGVLWTQRDLEIHCQQNSSISLVLTFLQVGASESHPA
ncbi:hypothetical protein GALMADRAFT_68561 [Galerina marginata CBS 339.88]|uniref:SEC7 domain-containing protein n=1 Tax=Galerina marginata (strain CBS 339.88) TaxID=685588 RepID=A0A067T9Y3_GALM3|nr:hypothetical protein GALMADRAFT_68561 [Galerina marginata CBS 339.88]